MAEFMIVAGNVIDGFRFIGPFPSADSACRYGESGASGLANLEWIIAPIEPAHGAAECWANANGR